MTYLADVDADVKAKAGDSPQSIAAFGRLPDEWARNPDVSPESLCLIAYRTTFGDERKGFGLWQDALSKILSAGFGRNVRERALAEAVRHAFMARPHNSTLPRGPGYTFQRPVDRLHLPECTQENSHVVWRSWFDGSLTRDAMAALLFVRAGTGKGPNIYTRELAERFDWSKPTALKVLRSLAARNLVQLRQDRTAAGRFDGVTYAMPVELTAKLPVPCPGNHRGQKTGARFTGARNAGAHTYGLPDGASSKLPHDENRTSPYARCASGRGAPLSVDGATAAGAGSPTGGAGAPGEGQEARQGGARGEARHPTFDGGARGQVSPIPPERIVLGYWKNTPYFHWEPPLAEDEPPEIMPLEDWRHQLRLYGGAPVQATTPEAHRQVREIAHELVASASWGNTEAIVPHYTAMLAVAAAICTAHQRGKQIYSLAFIAEGLVRKARREDEPAWAFNLPRRAIGITDQEYDAAAEFADKAVTAIETYPNAMIDGGPLRSTPQIERLAVLLREHGRDAMVAGINHANKVGVWPERGRIVTGWTYFVDLIGAAHQEQEAKAHQQIEAEVAAAVKWIETYLGTHWADPHKMARAAKKAGFNGYVHGQAKDRLKLRREKGLSGWLVALPEAHVPSSEAEAA
jgi:hypothetical protein